VCNSSVISRQDCITEVPAGYFRSNKSLTNACRTSEPFKKRLHSRAKRIEHYVATRNFLLLVSLRLGVVTVTKPVVAPFGTVAVR